LGCLEATYEESKRVGVGHDGVNDERLEATYEESKPPGVGEDEGFGPLFGSYL